MHMHDVFVYLMIVPQCISIISPEKSHCKSTLKAIENVCAHVQSYASFGCVHIGNNFYFYFAIIIATLSWNLVRWN